MKSNYNIRLSESLIILIFYFIFVSFCNLHGQSNLEQRVGGYTRLLSLGSNPFLVDPDNIKHNFAFSALYPNFIWGDLGASKPVDSIYQYFDDIYYFFDDTHSSYGGLGQFIGITYQINNEITVGALFNRDDFFSFNHSICNNYINNLKLKALLPMFKTNNTTFFGSYKFDKIIFGLGFSYYSNHEKYKVGLTDYKGDLSQYGINLSTISEIYSNLKFDASFNITAPSINGEMENIIPSGMPKTKIEISQPIFSFNLRGHYKMTNKLEFVPLIQYLSSNYSYKERLNNMVIEERKESYDIFGMKAGLVYNSDELLISLGTGIEKKGEFYLFPLWTLGTEIELLDWFYVRIGYQQTNIKHESNEMEVFQEWSNFRLGIGLKFKKFNLDFLVMDDILREGFKLIGGKRNTFAYISFSYAY